MRRVGVDFWRDEEFGFDYVQFQLNMRSLKSPFYHSFKASVKGIRRFIFGIEGLLGVHMERGVLGSRTSIIGVCNVILDKMALFRIQPECVCHVCYSFIQYVSFFAQRVWLRWIVVVQNSFMACTCAKCALSSAVLGWFCVKTVFGCFWLMCPLPGPVTGSQVRKVAFSQHVQYESQQVKQGKSLTCFSRLLVPVGRSRYCLRLHGLPFSLGDKSVRLRTLWTVMVVSRNLIGENRFSEASELI